METLENIDRLYIILPFAITYVVGEIIIKRKNSLYLTLKYRCIVYVIAFAFITFSIPHIFPGHYEDISDLDNKKMLLHNMQRDHEALVYTTEAFGYLFLWVNGFVFSVILPILKNTQLKEL